MHRTILLSLALVCSPAYLLGQWLYYPTAGVPRTAGGKPKSRCRSKSRSTPS